MGERAIGIPRLCRAYSEPRRHRRGDARARARYNEAAAAFHRGTCNHETRVGLARARLSFRLDVRTRADSVVRLFPRPAGKSPRPLSAPNAFSRFNYREGTRGM